MSEKLSELELWSCEICDKALFCEKSEYSGTPPNAYVHALSHKEDTATVRNPRKIMSLKDLEDKESEKYLDTAKRLQYFYLRRLKIGGSDEYLSEDQRKVLNDALSLYMESDRL